MKTIYLKIQNKLYNNCLQINIKLNLIIQILDLINVMYQIMINLKLKFDKLI